MTPNDRSAAERLREQLAHLGLEDWEVPHLQRALDAALAAARRETVERIRRDLPDDWTPWEPEKADEAFGYNDALRRVREALDSLLASDASVPEPPTETDEERCAVCGGLNPGDNSHRGHA